MLLDETAIAACMAYVDLNPVRANIAATPELSDFTSGQDRNEAAFVECSAGRVGDHLRLLEWTGRQIRSDKRTAMPANFEPLFERLGISTELWVDCVVNFWSWFCSSVGRPRAMESVAETRGHNRAISINSARRAFTSTAI